MVEAINKPTHMTEEEKQYQEDLKKSGVDLPEIKGEGETPEQKAEAEAKAKEEADAKAKADAEAKAKADEEAKAKGEGEDDKSKPPIEDKKRSIYDDYKEKKNELKTEKELREKAEKERDEFKALLEKSKDAKTPEEKKDALDEFDEFAKEIEADPTALKKMRELFIKDLKPDESLKKDLEEFKEWKASQDKVSVKTQFEEEYTKSLPALKTYFPKASDEEMLAVKAELDKISHSKGWNDKDLEYIAFKHKDSLSALISPKKRGMEGTDHKDDGVIDTDFDPNADYSKMSGAEKIAWEKKYQEFMKKNDGLSDGPGGRKIII